jgi:molybdopterin converting factor small subunit
MDGREIKVKVLYFAHIKDILKKGYDEIIFKTTENLDSAVIKIKDFDEIFNFILEINKDINSSILIEVLKTCILSLNDEYLENGTFELKNKDELSVIPPISAG